MRIERVASPEDPRLADYRMVRDPELVRRSRRFLAEGRLVVRTLLADSRLRALSVLCDETTLAWLEAQLGDLLGEDLPVYVAGAGLRGLGGWSFHQGCLALGERPPEPTTADLLAGLARRRLVVALERVSNPDNVGAIVRTAAAFGVDALVLGPGCAHPLYRKALRTSMGQALRLPFAHGAPWHESLGALRAAGFTLLALAPRENAATLEEARERLAPGAPRALLLGAEGDGLGATSLEAAEVCVRIPMPGGIDSLNVAAAAAVALYRLG